VENGRETLGWQENTTHRRSVLALQLGALEFNERRLITLSTVNGYLHIWPLSLKMFMVPKLPTSLTLYMLNFPVSRHVHTQLA